MSSDAYLKLLRGRHEDALERLARIKAHTLKGLQSMRDVCVSSGAEVAIGKLWSEISRFRERAQQELVEAQAHDQLVRDSFDEIAKAVVVDHFRVTVRPQHASNGLTYYVVLERLNRPTTGRESAYDGRLTPCNRHDVMEANCEGYAWAAFLGVAFTPCEAVADPATIHTVREAGVSQAGRFTPDDLRMTLAQAVEAAGSVMVNGFTVTFSPSTEPGRSTLLCRGASPELIEVNGKQKVVVCDTGFTFIDTLGQVYSVAFFAKRN